VILPEADAQGAMLVARRILEASEAPFAVEGQGLDVRASIGIALYPDHGEDAETLLRRADIAMYAAKRSGEGCATYSRERDGDGLNSLALTADLRRAMSENGLLVHYQPQVSLKTGQVIGFEALVRWQHPQRGLLSPSDFVSLAERTGLIKRLTDAVLETAFADCRAWRAVGYALPVAVNLSTRNLLDLDFADSITAQLTAHGLSPEWLTLEITEGVLMLDPARALQTLSRLRELGVRLSVDDFGTGYSSLSYLHGMRIDEVKIDKSFITNVVTEESSTAIVRSIIDLGHSLGVDVIAEGVEDAGAWELLRGLGCDAAQGYFVGRPMAFGELIKWLESGQWTPAGRPRAVGA
jgi:EAL domain-containing protein (putative c-di-GMP-specific phosphodiesterase class I)